METKVCPKCGREFPATLDFFYLNKSRKSGLDDYCKECKRQKRREYGKTHRPIINAQKARARKRNREKTREYSHRYYIEHHIPKEKPVCREGYKICSKCGKELPATEEFFRKDKRGRGGLYSQCNSCRNKASLDRYYKMKEEHPEKFKERNRKLHERNYPDKASRRDAEQREWYTDHKDEIDMRTERRKEVRRLWIEEHPDEWAALQEEYRENERFLRRRSMHIKRMQDPEAVRARKRAYEATHRDEINARKRAHPEWDCMHNERRRAAKAKVESTLTKAEWFATIEYFGNVCAYCGRPMKLTQDHFVPVSAGGGLTKANTIPACLSCNSSKQARPFAEWYKGTEFYSPEREQRILAFTGGNA